MILCAHIKSHTHVYTCTEFQGENVNSSFLDILVHPDFHGHLSKRCGRLCTVCISTYNILQYLPQIHVHYHCGGVSHAHAWCGTRLQHPLRTEGNLTPRQIFEVSPRSAEADTVDTCVYGVEEEGPVPDIDPENGVVVSPVSIHLLPAQEMSVMQIDPLHNDNNYGIDMYCSIRSIV